MDYAKLLKKYLDYADKKQASDLHLKSLLPAAVRVFGELENIDEKVLSPEEVSAIADVVLTEENKAALDASKDVDMSFSLDGKKRYRCNAYYDRNGLSLAIRQYCEEIQDFEKLGIPDLLKRLCLKRSGLILITGPTGSGKTTTLAALINYINNNRSGHIITVEDPIEFVFQSNKCMITQREINTDTPSFKTALRAILRQDPDIIVLGEMRDLESMSTALTAAETGHLVLATMHTTGAENSVDRIIDSFPADQQNQIRMQLAMVLTCIVSQQLIPRADGTGRILATEVMTGSSNVKSLIRQGKSHQMQNAMATGNSSGMYTINQCLDKLYLQGLISHNDYKIYQTNQIII